jgi:uncharacterized protein (TIGR03084 family)
LDTIVTALAEQHAELAGVLGGLGDADWERPSRCPGWTVADVVLHLAQTDELAVASLEGRFATAVQALSEGLGPAASVDDGADRMVASERGAPGPVVRARWEAGAGALRERLSACDPSDRVEWVAGRLSARTLGATRLAEAWIHTGDVAAAFGRTPVATERLCHVARLAWHTLPYAFARAGRELAGPVAFALRGPGAETWDLVPEEEPRTMVRGDALELCLVAARRVDPAATGLRAEGPDAEAVLELVRTYA